jgi:flagellar hook protein FlgE
MDFAKVSQQISGSNTAMNHYFDAMSQATVVGSKGSYVNFEEMVQGSGQEAALSADFSVSMKQGKIKDTGNPTNMAIDGNGFFMVSDGTETKYTRRGDFKFNESGNLSTQDGLTVQGYPLDASGNKSGEPGNISLALDPKTKLYGGKYTGFEVDGSGKVLGLSTITNPVTGQKITQKTPIYQVAMANFSDPTSLKPSGMSNFTATAKSGDAVVGVSGEGSFGKLCPKSLEMSNIDTVEMTMKAVEAKMAYNSSFAVFKTMDKMTQMAMQLIR